MPNEDPICPECNQYRSNHIVVKGENPVTFLTEVVLLCPTSFVRAEG